LAALLAVSCGRKIGDDCSTNIDCSQQAERICDIAQPGGYCTVEGCDERTCPDESVCIRFFPRLFLSDRCQQGVCGRDELCLPDGWCAPRGSERRYCAATCGGDEGCRRDYQCTLAGTQGTMPLLPKPGKEVRFCAPAEPRK
jgi:hypothetical protein